MKIDRTLKKRIIWGSASLILALFLMNGCSTYNTLVENEEGVSKSWSQVENVYQRRVDLIPNLIETVKGYADHEKSTLNEVIEARAKATSVTIDPSNMTPGQLAQFDKYQNQLSSSLSKLMLVVESYPNLKANENFLSLQAELAGTENRIAVERKKFNDMTEVYNKKLRKFPSNIWANMFGFDKKLYFKANKNASIVPKVKF